MTAGVESMFSLRLEPWHKTGTILEEEVTNSADAMRLAGLDWKVERKELSIETSRSGSVDYGIETIKFKPIRNRVALVRMLRDEDIHEDNETDHIRVLSVVSDKYQVLQNSEAFDFFDPLVQAGVARYETAGSLFLGRKVWILARIDEAFEVTHGDEVRPYVLLCNGHDGMTGVIVQQTNIRVVCNNTLQMALSERGYMTIKHRGNLRDQLKTAQEVIGFSKEQLLKTKAFFVAMSHKQLSLSERADYIRSLIPEAPMNATDRVKRRIAEEQDKILQLLEEGSNTELVHDKGTLWALYNAAIEFCDHYLGARSRDRANFQLFGAGAAFKKRAAEMAQRILKGPLPINEERRERGLQAAPDYATPQ